MAIRDRWSDLPLWARAGIIGFLVIFLGALGMATASGKCSAFVDASSCSSLQALVWFPNIVLAFVFGVMAFAIVAIIAFLITRFLRSV